MANRQTNAARLREALRQWYVNSPPDPERERMRIAAERYRELIESPQRVGFAPEFDRRRLTQPMNALRTPGDGCDAILDRGLAGPDDGGDFIEIGNPHNRRLKGEHIRKYGSWPVTDDGRPYDVAHKRAIADGGTNTLDNIEPMHPDEHKAKHLRDGDAGRWGRRASIAKTFGGRVEPPTPRSRLHGFGLLQIPSNILGMFSGSIRRGSPSNFVSDMVGVPSPEDMARERARRAWEKEKRSLEIQRQLFPDCPPGYRCL